MLRPLTVTATFDWDMNMEEGGGQYCIATLSCRATADVRPGEPRTWHDPGCGPEVENFRDIEVEGMRFIPKAPDGKRWDRKWFTPHDTLRDWILSYLNTGAADADFADAADDIGYGPDPDMQREARAG